MAAATMKDRPIPMHARSIRGILENRKVQTRRLNGLATVNDEHPDQWTLDKLHVVNARTVAVFRNRNVEWIKTAPCPYGQPGDGLWVRESFYIDDYRVPEVGSIKVKPEFDKDAMYYRADGECCDQIPECQCADTGKPRWRNARFMPRWASRLTLEITDIRVERVQDISIEDIKAEGVQIPVSPEGRVLLNISTDNKPPCRMYDDPQNATLDDYFIGNFAMLWDETNGKGAWSRNDWCWCISFRRVA